MYQGSIKLIIGPMYAGKTSELLRLKSRSDITGQKSIIIKYSNDTRYTTDAVISTHNKITINKDIIISSGNSLNDTIKNIDISDIIYFYIDEIQFYYDAHEVLNKLANELDKHIICSCLQGDYKMEIFPVVAKLIPCAESIIHLTAIDKDSKTDAAFTKRIVNNENLELIGSTDMYKAVNRYNWGHSLI